MFPVHLDVRSSGILAREPRDGYRAPRFVRSFLETPQEQRATRPVWLAPVGMGASEDERSAARNQSLMQLITAAQEDLNRVYNLVHEGGYAVVLCDSEGEPIYVHDPRNSAEHRPALLANKCQPGISLKSASISATAIFEEDDSPVAFLGAAPAVPSMSEPPRSIIGAVLRASARAIEERLFRARHRSAWIIAGVHHAENRSDILLAVDGNAHIVGADRTARRLLSREEHSFTSTLSLWAVFERNRSFSTLPHADDLACTLVYRRTAEKWWALITPPALAQQWNGLDTASANTRPRIDAVGPAYEAVFPKHSRGGLAPCVVRRVRKYIDACIESHIDVEVLANMAGLSPAYFSRAFKQSVGMAPHSYVVLRRLQKACGLLRDTDLCLAEVALACGFADQSHFSRVFSQKLRTTPGAWRRARELVGPQLDTVQPESVAYARSNVAPPVGSTRRRGPAKDSSRGTATPR